MSSCWEDEITELIPRTVLTQLQERSRRPSVVVTARRLPSPGAVDDELHRDDFADEESPSTLTSLADLELVQRGLPATKLARADLELVRQAVRATEIPLADLELESALEDLDVVQRGAAFQLADLELVPQTARSRVREQESDRALVQVAVRSTEIARVGLAQVQRAVRSTELALADFELVERATELELEDLELIEAVTTEVSRADLERIREAIRSTEVSLASLELGMALENPDGSMEVSLADLDVIDGPTAASPPKKAPGFALAPLEPVQLGTLESAPSTRVSIADRLHASTRVGALLVTGLITLGGGL